MNHAQLRAFHAVAEAGSFTRAAGKIGVSQPTLSTQVKALEEGYGAALFHRNQRRITLTGIGRALHDITQRYFAMETEAEHLLRAARGLVRGSLRVTADSPYHVVPVLAVFAGRYPGIEISVSSGNSRAVQQSVLTKDSDVGVVPDFKLDRRLAFHGVWRDRLVGFVARSHHWSKRRTIALDKLAEETLIMREPGSTTRALVEQALGEVGVQTRQYCHNGEP